MKITLSPQRRDDGPLTLSRQGDVLTIDSVVYDFSPLPDGGTLPGDAVDCQWLVGDVERIDGKLQLTLLLPHGSNAPEATRFPAPIIDPPDGEVLLPLYDAPEEEGQ
jgi:hypothetical protein